MRNGRFRYLFGVLSCYPCYLRPFGALFAQFQVFSLQTFELKLLKSPKYAYFMPMTYVMV